MARNLKPILFEMTKNDHPTLIQNLNIYNLIYTRNFMIGQLIFVKNLKIIHLIYTRNFLKKLNIFLPHLWVFGVTVYIGEYIQGFFPSTTLFHCWLDRGGGIINQYFGTRSVKIRLVYGNMSFWKPNLLSLGVPGVWSDTTKPDF